MPPQARPSALAMPPMSKYHSIKVMMGAPCCKSRFLCRGIVKQQSFVQNQSVGSGPDSGRSRGPEGIGVLEGSVHPAGRAEEKEDKDETAAPVAGFAPAAGSDFSRGNNFSGSSFPERRHSQKTFPLSTISLTVFSSLAISNSWIPSVESGS